MKKSLLSLLVVVTSQVLLAQNSISDCVGAIVLCDDFYSEDQAPLNSGNFYEFTGACNQNLEQSSVWYTFTVQQAGNLSFVLTPNDLSDDYDWGLFNITNGGCAGIGTGASPTVSCNSWGIAVGNNGPTGISTSLGGISNTGGPGNFNGPPFNANLPVQIGQSYALVVMNWSNSPYGYSIDFSQSSASLFDAIPPAPVAVSTDCSNSVFTLQMSEGILTSSIQPADFLLINSNGANAFVSAVGQNPLAPTNNTIILTLAEPVTEAGMYSLLFTGLSNFVVDGCDNPAEGSIDIELFAPITYDVTTTAACNGAGGSMLFSNLQGGEEPYIVSVNGFELTELFLDGVPPANFPVTITDANGCFINTIVTIPDQDITLSVGVQDSLTCSVESVMIQNIIVEADQEVAYQWTPVSSTSSIEGASDVLYPTVTGSGVYELVVTNLISGCNSSVYVEIEYSDNLQFDDGILTFDTQIFPACNGTDGAVQFNNLSGGEGPYTITLNDVDYTQYSIENLPAGNLPVVITDNNGCFITSEIAVPDQILLVSVGLQDTLSCTVHSVTIEDVVVSPAQTVSYQWSVLSSGGAFQGSQSIENPVVTDPGVFQIVVTDQSTGCSASTTVEVFEDPDLQFADGILQYDLETINACNGTGGAMEFANISGGIAPYSIAVNGSILNGSVLGNLPPGTYPVVIADFNNCFSAFNVNITNHNISVSIGIQDTLNCLQTSVSIGNVVITPQQEVNYQWTVVSETGSLTGLTTVQNPVVTEAGVFSLTVTYPATGCNATATTEVFSEQSLEFDENDLAFPNIVSPNNDGKNDLWIPFLRSDPDFNVTDLMNEFELLVYNRWGNLIYESSSSQKYWNPSDAGEGVYFYTLRFKISCGDEIARDFGGSVQVVK